MFRKITIFFFIPNKNILFFVLFFCIKNVLFCQSMKYNANENSKELKKIYQKLFTGTISSQEIQKLMHSKYPVAQDTLIYQAKLNDNSENSLLSYYRHFQQSLIWYLMGLLLLHGIMIFLIAPFIKWKKTLYGLLLTFNFVLFFQFKSYFLFQEWIFLPSNSTVYESTSFASRSNLEFNMPQIALIIKKQDFWYKIETENGIFWIPEFSVIK